MPLSNKQLGNTFIQGQNIIIYPSGNSYVISKPDTESYGATGIGVAGVDNWPPSPIYVLPIALQDLSGPNSTMIYKSFSAGTGIGIIDSNNSLIFTASTPTVNGLTSFTSAGTGNRLLLSTAITSNTLFYKSITGTSNLDVNDNNGTLTFSLAGSGAGTIISGINVGTNANSIGFFTGLSTTTNPNDTLAFRNLLAGPNISISPSVANNGDILISRGSPILVNQLSNIGDGARVLSSITTTNLLVARSLLGANGFTTSLGAGLISPTSSTDSDATAFITAASITDSRQITAIQNLVSDLKTNNIWDKMLAIYPIIGGTANSHKYNLKDPRNLDAAYRLDFGTQNVIHDSNGIRSDAADSASQPTINTFIRFNLISALTDNIHLSFYSRTDVNNAFGTSKGANIGNTTGNTAFRSYPRYNNLWTCQIGDSGTVFPTVSDSLGFYIASRTSSTGNTFYKNGFLSAITSNTVHLSSITGTILLMRHLSNPENTRQMAFYSFGSGLTNSEALAYTTAVENYQATLGRQVITLQNQTVRIEPTVATANRLFFAGAGGALTTNSNFGADVTSGSLSIGAAVSTTSRLLLGAGTGAISQLRLTPFTATTSLIDGDIWYSTTGNTLKFYKNNISTDFIFKDNNNSLTGSTAVLFVNTGGSISPKYVNSFGIFNALSSVTISNTTSETSTISPVLTGSTTLFASTNAYNPELGIGRKYRFSARGILGSDVPPVNLNIRIKLDSTIISSSLTITIGAIDPISLEFDIESTFTVRNSGLIIGSGKMIFSAPPSDIGGNPVIFGIYSQNATIDTTSNKVFDCTLQLDVADPTNFITIYESTLEILN
jgi:hypothetical protein